jgi:hypothetical protein
VPDTMFGIIEYPKSDKHPEFTFAMRVNFKSSEPQERFGFKFVGSEGTITTDIRSVTLSRKPREKEPGYTIGTFAKAQQEAFVAGYRKQYPPAAHTMETMNEEGEQRWVAGSDAHRDHMAAFIQAVRSRKPHFEDARFGLAAAGPALLGREDAEGGLVGSRNLHARDAAVRRGETAGAQRAVALPSGRFL